MVNWRRGALVYVHSPMICETYIWCSGIPQMYGQFEGVEEGGTSALGISVYLLYV